MDEINPLLSYLQNISFRIVDANNDYNKVITLARLYYQSLPLKLQKNYSNFKKILDQYDNNPELRRKAHQLLIISQEPEAHHEYITKRNKEEDLQYDEKLEYTIHHNTNAIITLIAETINQLSQEEEIQL